MAMESNLAPSKAYLLDTCTLLWLCLEPEKVSERVQQVVTSADSSSLFVSVVSEWEILLKAGLGKLKLTSPTSEFLIEAKAALTLVSLPLEAAHCYRFGLLGIVNRDPFDKMLAAQSIENELPILTPDLVIARYGAKTVW
jgi:PIN domain nuclease of toxin-antitoxin system